MSTVWRARLKELLEENNALHNTAAALLEAPTSELVGGEGAGGEKARTRETPTAKTAETPSSNPIFSKSVQTSPAKTAKTPAAAAPPKREPTDLSEFAMRKLEQASEMGLVAAWSWHFGYVSIHDPTTGEWHDLSTEDAPGWAKREAHWRKGKKEAYSLTSREVEERRASERADSHPAVTDKGILFEDYIKET